jgi:hypothetical protein
MIRYVVDTCRDDVALLQAQLDKIANTGGRIVNVMWQVEQTVVVLGEEQPKVLGGFVIVSELAPD